MVYNRSAVVRAGTAFLLLLILSGCGSGTSMSGQGEIWPTYTADPGWKPLVTRARDTYIHNGDTYARWLQDYRFDGDYFNMGQWLKFTNTPTVKLDAQGIPMVKYGTGFYYNPVTVSQYCLAAYGRYIAGDAQSRATFKNGLEKLLSLQDADGKFRYGFTVTYHNGAQFAPGWISGMAQGQALSAFARGYLVFKDPRYLDAGNRSLEVLNTPTEQGGARATLADLHPSLAKRYIFDEYPCHPHCYTLNGSLFALFGLYDWAKVAGGVQEPEASAMALSAFLANQLFQNGVQTIARILPYYDVGGFTAYDMTHVIYKTPPYIDPFYHAWHIAELHALYSITGLPEFKHYENLWASYV